jgi:SAM-dependent methyltransferase
MRDNVERLHRLHCHLHNEGTEIITPLPLVHEMLDRLPPEVWSDPSKRFLDPACGMGTFVFAAFARLMEGLVDAFPDRRERAHRILTRMLWAYDVSEEKIDVVRAGFRAMGLEHSALNVYNCNTLEQEFDMKFDVIIGNPPYNPPAKEYRGGSGSGNKIWQKFIEKAFDGLAEDGTVAMVTPTTWRHGSFNKNRQHKRAQELIFTHGVEHWEDAKKHFPMVGHSIGIDWWVARKGSPISIENNPLMLLTRRNDGSMRTLQEWLQALEEDCYEQNVGLNDCRKFNHQRGEVATSNCPYPHLASGSNTRKNVFDWYDVKTKGFDEKKVMIHDSSGPQVFYDRTGEYGCGTHCTAYTVASDAEAQEIIDFFGSKLCSWLVLQVAEKNAIAFPTFLFKRIPKNWRELEEKHFG